LLGALIGKGAALINPALGHEMSPSLWSAWAPWVRAIVGAPVTMILRCWN